jgi:hypothetical protein
VATGSVGPSGLEDSPTSPRARKQATRAESRKRAQIQFNGTTYCRVALYPHAQKYQLMKRLYDYTVVLRPDDNGTFVAFVPAIPGCHTWGKTPEEAQAELLNVFDMIRENVDFNI